MNYQKKSESVFVLLLIIRHTRDAPITEHHPALLAQRFDRVYHGNGCKHDRPVDEQFLTVQNDSTNKNAQYPLRQNKEPAALRARHQP